MGKLRKAVINDAEAIANILIQSRKAFLPYAPLAHSEDEVHQWVKEHLIPSKGVTVYVCKGKVTGLLAVSNHEGTNWIDQLYITPSMVGQGIGTKLLEYSLKRLVRPVRL
jgi:N-acetylglutamate synthase-like GNAT family acetyltransferase